MFFEQNGLFQGCIRCVVHNRSTIGENLIEKSGNASFQAPFPKSLAKNLIAFYRHICLVWSCLWQPHTSGKSRGSARRTARSYKRSASRLSKLFLKKEQRRMDERSWPKSSELDTIIY